MRIGAAQQLANEHAAHLHIGRKSRLALDQFHCIYFGLRFSDYPQPISLGSDHHRGHRGRLQRQVTTAYRLGPHFLGTNDQTPELTGTIDDATATVSVTVDGSTYPATNNGTTWTLADGAITPALAAGAYNVLVSATDAAGNIGNDATVDELVIEAAVVKEVGCAATGGGGLALVLPLALALAALKRR